jgi:hypothetical protein
MVKNTFVAASFVLLLTISNVALGSAARYESSFNVTYINSSPSVVRVIITPLPPSPKNATNSRSLANIWRRAAKRLCKGPYNGNPEESLHKSTISGEGTIVDPKGNTIRAYFSSGLTIASVGGDVTCHQANGR